MDRDSLQLVVENQSKKNIDKCIICQANKGNTNLTSTLNGRLTLIDCSNFLKDDLLDGVEDLEKIKYHTKPCFSNYKKQKEKQKERSERKHNLENDETVPEDEPSTSEQVEPVRSSKRLKIDPASTTPKIDDKDKEKKPCIVCNQMKCKGVDRRYRICEADRAKLFLSAMKYNKDVVYTRCSLFESIGDVFANDVMYHKNCMANYLRKFEREIEQLLNPPLTRLEKRNMTVIFEEFVVTIDIQNKACALSTCRDQFQQYLENVNHDQGILLFYSAYV